ncbi:MAG: hypothetical protein R8K22_07775 [Mariprofundaceae bacterium]
MDNTAVVIVNFNCGPLLTDCVRSVLASTVPEQVLLSDNASSDGSIGQLKGKIQDSRLQLK